MSVTSRIARLGGMTGTLARSAVREKMRDTFRSAEARMGEREQERLERVRQVADRLSKMKGAAMKVGQQAAVLAVHLDMPQDIQQALGKLHAEAEPVPFPTIRASVERELEGPISDIFASFDPRPLGTASLAQAHAATLPDGRQVVVKVLHDGVEKSVQADLLALRAMLVGGRVLGRNRAELDGMFGELRARLMEELDYLQEAVNLQQFHEALGDDPRYRMPRHHPSLCTERVIVLDRLYGQPIDAFAASADREITQRAGIHLGELILEMAFRHRLLHADPHPGNYLFEPDGRIGVLDFGCVKRFSPFWIGSYARLVVSALDRDDDAVLQATRDLGAWSGNNREAAAVIVAFCNAVLEPMRDGKEMTIGGPDDDVVERVKPIIESMWRFKEITGPKDILFLHRTLGGAYAMARKLEVTTRWEPRLREHLGHAIEVAEGRTPAG